MKKTIFFTIFTIILNIIFINTTIADTQPIQTIKIAHVPSSPPYDFVNEKGESDGFEVAVLKEVNKQLPQYKFVFVPTSDEDLLIGIVSGKYALGTKSAWSTEERRKKYLIPKHPVAASIIGLVIHAKNKNKFVDLKSFGQHNGKLVPISPQNAQYAVLEDFNKNNPSTPIKLIPSEIFKMSDAFRWIIEGRYDAYFTPKHTYKKNVVEASAPYHKFQEQFHYIPYKAIPTYPLFNKQQQQLVDEYDKAIETLHENGTLNKLSQQYFQEDIFKLTDVR